MFVSNASTIILLAKCSGLSKFVDKKTIIIPLEVYEEVTTGNHYDKAIIVLHIEQKKIMVDSFTERKRGIESEFHLDKGELAAYLLFDAKKHQALLTDDFELIKLCRITNTPYLTSLSIIIWLLEANKLTTQEAIEKIETLKQFGRYKKEVIDYFVNQVKNYGNNISKNG